ncbi:acetyltransferase, GNAT family [Marvinbryantia formatexigens DSM 14469]|uniref:Acetyltransferase, GNAT family n=1 Tax=Marvinbryantia formatexigens DSM 14469 TaxID=478749 RepID=C6LKG6_9FIRM|nr:GNAT family N-acetyltransferase [Marvinbryantia formatexigens]EET58865.1 acetyltransferase, GNAT family [Marvinbryantia formatexigens DSM 14469]UWO26733.1 GNAT family N-acetyltransferase [Marvinbryantia formatexigens DSM 14469]SDG87527.1 Acetyltransferase (GNAT) family protein [Marvinbryantia formatexigens]
MIRPLEKKDIKTVCNIVNDNWKNVYTGIVNPFLLSEEGCAERIRQLESDFSTHRLSEYVWEEDSNVEALLSIGDTIDTDITGAFEIWRVYVSAKFQGKGIGRLLLDFAQQKAKEQGYKRIVIWAFKDNYRAVSFYQKNGYCIDKEEYLGEPYFAIGVRLKKEI